MRTVYTLGLYLILILFFPFWVLLFLFNPFRFRERTGLTDPDALDSRPSLWIHGASLGEMTIVRKLLPGLKIRFPGRVIVVSSTTATGRNHILRKAGTLISHALSFPLEFPFCSRRMFRLARPEIVVVTETELWPHFLFEAKKAGARLVLVNGRLSDRTFPTYRLFRGLFTPVLRSFDVIAVQTEEYRARFIALGADPERVKVTGNIKETLILAEDRESHRQAIRARFDLSDKGALLIAASTRPGEEEILLSAFEGLRKEFPDLKLLLAPRHLSRLDEIRGLLSQRGLRFVCKSGINGKAPPFEIILLDTLGELSDLFAAGDLAFVGGSLKDFGGHNLLEPLPHLVPVCFGPFVSTQRQSARLIIDEGCGREVRDEAEFVSFARSVLTDPELRKRMEEGIRRLVKRSHGPLERNLDLI